MRRSALAALVLMLVPACESGCTPTTTTAGDTAVLNVGDPARSGVLEAVLVSQGTPLEGKQIEFFVSYDDPVSGEPRERLLGEAETDAEGRARFDLKRHPSVGAVQGVVEAEYVGRFTYDGTYCSSEDEAPLRIVATP